MGEGEDTKDESIKNNDPVIPVARKGVLLSFLTKKPMEIPEQDIVRKYYIFSQTLLAGSGCP